MTDEYGTAESGTAWHSTGDAEMGDSAMSGAGSTDAVASGAESYQAEPYDTSYGSQPVGSANQAVSAGAVPPPPPPQYAAEYPAAVPVGYAMPGTLLESGQLPAGVTLAGPGIRLGSFLISYLLVQVTLYIGWIIWAIIISGKGQTPGKQILNLRVIDKNTLQPVGFASLFFMRGIVGGLVAAILVPLTLGIILFMPLWDSKNQNIWDKVSGTYVVSDPFNAWAL